MYDTANDPTAPAIPSDPPPVKPGWQTTEFYFGLFAKLLGGAYATGLIGEGTTYARIAGLAVVVLAYFGYTVSRTLVKTAGALLLIAALGSTQVSCATARPRATAGYDALIDCTTPSRATVVADLGQALVDYARKYVSGDGQTVNIDKLKASAAALKGDVVGSCALVTALAILAARKPEAARSLLAAPPTGPDPEQWRGALEAVQLELGVRAAGS